jgi:hypothetical protein
VKNWKARRSKQILRWVTPTLVEHGKKMHRPCGMSQTALFIAALGPKQLAAEAA